MKVGSMNNPRLSVEAEIDRIGKAGFDFIDLTYEWPSNQKLSPESVKTKITEYGLDVVGHTSPSLPAIYPLESIKQDCLLELRSAVDFLVSAGARKINVHPFYFLGYKKVGDIIKHNIDLLEEINSYCQDKEVELMLENFRPPFNCTEIFELILKSVPGIKVHLDIGHLNIFSDLKEALTKFLTVFGDQIIHCHIHDNNEDADEHLPLGCGNIDWPFVVKTLKKTGYDETFTLEIFCPDHYFLDYSRKKWQKLWLKA